MRITRAGSSDGAQTRHKWIRIKTFADSDGQMRGGWVFSIVDYPASPGLATNFLHNI